MTKFFQQVFNILTSPPGNLIYHLILVFSIAISLQIVLSFRRRGKEKQINRTLFGLFVLLFGQLALFLSSGLAWQNLADPQFYLPSLDRAVTALSLIWIIWILAYTKSHQAVDAVNGLLNLITIILLIFTLATWRNTDPGLAFNNSGLDLGWGILCIFLSLSGILLLLLEKPASWGIAVSFLLLHIAGYIVHLVYTGPIGDFAAPLRLAQICTYPLLPVLILRGIQPNSQSAPAIAPAADEKEPFIERRRYTADPRATYNWLNLAAQENEEEIHQALTRAIAQTLLADICLLFQKSKFSDELLLCGGYDLIREDEITSTMTLQKTTLPTIAGAIERGKSLLISPQDQPLPDFDALVEILGLEKSGNLLFVPISIKNVNWGGLALLAPYSHRVWENQDETYLTSAANLLAQILEQAEQREKDKKAFKQLENELEIAQQQLNNLQVGPSPAKLSATAETFRPKPETEEDLEKLIALQTETQLIIQQLKAENEQLSARLLDSEAITPDKSDTAFSEIQSELRLALQEVAHLQNELADINLKNVTLEKEMELSSALPQNNPKITNAIFQELRQPLASIVGYTDLLLAETGGILGALQQSFLERIKASLERINAVLENLSGNKQLNSGFVSEVNLDNVIDGSISAAGEQLREKRVTLRMDIPDKLPEILADQDTLEQIIKNLLNNAVIASPFEGAITLRVAHEDREDNPYLLVEVEDSGGGIDPEDLQRVFLRRYRGDNPVISGIGDTGVGLTIAKTLTEALGGRIWVHSEIGQGTTFSVLLPIIHKEDVTVNSQK